MVYKQQTFIPHHFEDQDQGSGSFGSFGQLPKTSAAFKNLLPASLMVPTLVE